MCRLTTGVSRLLQPKSIEWQKDLQAEKHVEMLGMKRAKTPVRYS